MSKTLSPGQWCRPKDEKEWKAILDLAESLGVRRHIGYNQLYDSCRCVAFYSGVYASSSGAHEKEIMVSEFICRMYATAEANKCPEAADCGRLDALEKRVDALEMKLIPDAPKPCAKEFADTQRLAKELRPVFASQGDMVGALERISALEDAAERPESRTPDRSGLCGPGYSMSIDPKASPRGIPFSVALEFMKVGRNVRRKRWNSGAAYFIKGGDMMFRPHGYDAECREAIMSYGEVTATDWEVIPE